MINFIPFKIFRGLLLHKPVTGQELFAVSYSKPALGSRLRHILAKQAINFHLNDEDRKLKDADVNK